MKLFIKRILKTVVIGESSKIKELEQVVDAPNRVASCLFEKAVSTASGARFL